MSDPGRPIKAVPDIGVKRLKDKHICGLFSDAFPALWPLVAKGSIPVPRYTHSGPGR